MADLSLEAYNFIKKAENQKKLCQMFTGGKDLISERQSFTYFMAGAPGSGKTEIVKSFSTEIFNNCIIADADEIRKFLPQYTGDNSYKVQRAASKGMEILFNYALKKKLNILIDGTFANFEKSREDISRSLKRNRSVVIFYLYTNPRVAWSYAKKRQYVEGRKIGILVFIKAFFKCRENINKIKKEFGNQVYIVGMKSNYRKGVAEYKVNIKDVDEIQKIDYNYISLLVRVIYANILLQKERLFLWRKKKLKK